MEIHRPIEELLESDNLDDFKNNVERAVNKDKNILGVLAVGSLVQLPTPSYFYEQVRQGRAADSYELIRRPLRRKDGMSKDSDLDIWVCTRDSIASTTGRHKVDIGGMALIEELASGTITKGDIHWRNKKLQAFGQYYKKSELYPIAWQDSSAQPWMADEFKSDLEKLIMENMPAFTHNVNAHFNKGIPGKFLEIRAFPESLFNLRPDEALLANGLEDRAPFPRIADNQWISTEHNAVVLYAHDDIAIQPFVQEGELLGSAIADHINFLYTKESNTSSLGGIMLKPDAFNSGQIELIRTKVRDMIKVQNGRIVTQEQIQLDDRDLESIYPILNISDRHDIKGYLQSGPVEIIIIELPCGPYEVSKIINSVKGERIGERSLERLQEGRKTDGTVRDLLPLPGDEEKYKNLIHTILMKKDDPSIRFSDEDYSYYVKNLMHTPDNSIELNGLIEIVEQKGGDTDD